MRSQILLVLFILTVGSVASAQTLQTVVNNGNTVTTPVKFNGRADFGESYDASQYGAIQIARPVNQGSKFHVSFIRSGQMVYGMGFLNNSNVFGIQPGSDNSSSNGIFMGIDGKVGIGTISPEAKLHVAGNVKFFGNYDGTNNVQFSTSGTGNTWELYPQTTGFGVFNRNNSSWPIFIANNDNVGIGTNNPQGYKLAVAGSVIAESVKVKLQGTWPDFVFAKDYILPTILETKKHIKEKGHLPGIPSAAEVEKNGIELGDMNKKLLQKIEELTLYVINQEDRIKALETKVKTNTKK
jgi:hypothetical protein